jgi:hypothetical protein
MIHLKAIGSDPEMFLFKNGSPVSAIGLAPGSKKNPFKISDHESVQVDNVAIEFNTKPTLSTKEFKESLNRCYEWMANHLSMVDKEIQVVPIASAMFPDSELKTRASKRFGCDPDFNAWTGKANTPPSAPGNLRSCGGHIHLGLAVIGELDYMRLIRLMDKNVGTYTTAICGDQRRHDLYGKAGAYRLKPYGVEYRTPSISWVKDDESIEQVFYLTQLSVNEYNEGMDANPSIQEKINKFQFTTHEVSV